MNCEIGSGLQEWIHTELSKVLGFEVPEEMSRYILSMETERDLEDYCNSLLNFSDEKHSQFYNQLLQRRRGGMSSSIDPTQPLGYIKPQREEIYFVGNTEKKSKNKKDNQKKVQSQAVNDEKPLHRPQTSEKENIQHIEVLNQSQISMKKRPKFVNLYSQEGQNKDIILLKGRHVCNCQATKHKLINNCLKCGRIVCEQEGGGPCLFCGNLVCTAQEMEILQRNSKQSGTLYKKLMNQGKPAGLDAAMAQRNRLLEYDRTSERRTKVIDDESDYYSANSVWLSDAEREKLKKLEEAERARKHASRRDARFTLDFAGRQVVEEKVMQTVYDEEDKLALRELYASGVHTNLNMDPGVDFPDLVFEDAVISPVPRQRGSADDSTFPQYSRVQDREFLEMSDTGRCLSMHQPWASLLIAGIKLHEGRNWYSAHRGRLWIAAAGKTPDPEEIRIVEHAVHILRKDEHIRFPEHYPTGCLLGCVNMIDCLAQEEYRERYPLGESDSPFVFICEDPQPLRVRFPMQGQHKIYQLDPKIHSAAQKSLQRMAKIDAERGNILSRPCS